MKSKNRFPVSVVLALAVAGAVFATGMGYKIVYSLPFGNSGTNKLGLPYFQRTGLVNAEDLIDDINDQAGSDVVASVARHVRATDLPESYTGSSGVNFTLTPGEGYAVVLTASAAYSIIGSHDPGLLLDLLGPEDSASGTNDIVLPYHTSLMNAEDLIDDIEAQVGDVVASVSRHINTTDLPQIYTGVSGTNFSLTIGETYRVVVTKTVDYLPSHY